MAIIGFVNKDGTISPKTGSMPITDYMDYPLPCIHLSGDIAGMTKDNDVTLNYIYKDRSGSCTLKWQGSSSAGLPKKNYTIKFDNAFEVVDGWGAQKKYCLKANYVDSSHARNIVCAKLWGQIVKSRTPANDTLNTLPNGGAIDGFPILLSINGEFQGLYTWNIPKDGWMMGMSDATQQQAILCAELNNNGATAFKGLATLEADADGKLDFDLEYSSDGQKDWVLASLNRLLAAVKDSDGTNITYGIAPYLDLESAIDYFIHTVLTANYDGIYRNYLLATHDGVKWFFTGYDMDVVLGLRAMGRYFYSAAESVAFATVAGQHKLFGLIWKYLRPQLRDRYNELRAAAMSVENVANMFADYVAEIPLPVYIDDVRLWNGIPSNSANNLAQIITYYDLRCRNADEWMKSTSGQTELPEQVDPSVYSVTNTLSNCSTSNSATTVTKGNFYSAIITAHSGYELSSVVVTMGGVDITSTAYANGEITITSVTGDIVITATATVVVVDGYTNQVPISIDTDKSIFNTTGYRNGYRLSSSGAVKAQDEFCTATGFIPAKGGDVIRIGGIRWYGNTGNAQNYLCAYDASFAHIGCIYGQKGEHYGTEIHSAYELTTALSTVTLKNIETIAYIRVSCRTLEEAADGADLIVTVNQEITD